MNRIGEERVNNFGSKMKIIKYNGVRDVDVYFEEYDWIAKNKQYNDFLIGNIKCPYEPRTKGVGYLGEGNYKTRENNKKTKCYLTWIGMLTRCYDSKYHEKYPTYIGCKVCDEWLNFQNFAEWYYDNYYEVDSEVMCLDKDILVKGNKIYSPETCIFVPEKINLLFTKSNKSRGKYPIGVVEDKRTHRFNATGYLNNSKTTVGVFDTPEEAFYKYKEVKENHIKEIAENYKDKIPNELYKALINYKVEIND